MTYHKVGLLTMRGGRILLCRKKRSSALLILPGGCLEPGESHDACLRRELREELGEVALANPRFLGTYSDRAASGDGTVRVELYSGELIGEPAPRAEIEELVWFASDGDRGRLAPSIANQILPDLIARGILPWP